MEYTSLTKPKETMQDMDGQRIPSMMRGVVLPGGDRTETRRYAVPKPGPGQVLVQMKASGLCGSDLKFIYHEHIGTGGSQYQEVIAGHEPSGQIVAVGPEVSSYAVGDRVVVDHINGCGHCSECRKGCMIGCTSPERQAYGWQRDGGHADYLLADVRALLKLPEPLTYIDGAMVACGVATAYQGITRASVSGRDRLLVVGLGPVGLAVVMLAAASGAEVYGVDVVPERIALAKTLGATAGLMAGLDALPQIMDLTQGMGTEVAIDCSGHRTGRHLCLEAARTWGRVVFLGEGGDVAFEPSPLLIRKQWTLYGSWVCGLDGMAQTLEFLVRSGLHPDALVTHTFSLSDAERAYQTFARGTTGKVVLTMDEASP